MGDAQMPTTLTGLLLFVVMLLPGFAYLVGKERNGSERRTSPFRETVAVVAASVTSELAVLVLFAILRGLLPTRTPDVGALIRHGGAYLRGSNAYPGHYGEVTIWATGMLVFAVAFAYFATSPRIRRWPKGAYPHDSTVSAWWLLFERWPGKRDVQVTCTLDDGWAIRGRLQSFNNSADDSPARDLILKRPIEYRQPAEAQWHDFNARYACLSAGRIVTLFVSYPPLAEAEAELPPLAAQGNPLEGQPIVIGQPEASDF
jgi:hypothetical protein